MIFAVLFEQIWAKTNHPVSCEKVGSFFYRLTLHFQVTNCSFGGMPQRCTCLNQKNTFQLQKHNLLDVHGIFDNEALVFVVYFWYFYITLSLIIIPISKHLHYEQNLSKHCIQLICVCNTYATISCFIDRKSLGMHNVINQ